MPNETCDKQLAGAGSCHLPAAHEGECDHEDKQSTMEEAHQQQGEWLDDFIHHRDNQA